MLSNMDGGTRSAGRPRIEFSDDQLKTLMELKTFDQMSWAALAEWYEGEYGTSIHPQTLRRALLRDAPMLTIPSMVSERVKEAISQVWEGVDLMKIMMFMVNSRFVEYIQLYEKMIRAGVEEPDDDVRIEFTLKDQGRMDELFNTTSSLFLRSMDIMKDLQSGNIAGQGMEFLIWAKGKSDPTDVPAALPEGQSIDQIIADVMKETHGIMEDINDQHREAARGMYRVIDEETDFEEEKLS